MSSIIRLLFPLLVSDVMLVTLLTAEVDVADDDALLRCLIPSRMAVSSFC